MSEFCMKIDENFLKSILDNDFFYFSSIFTPRATGGFHLLRY
jgi:hypothetical protein